MRKKFLISPLLLDQIKLHALVINNSGSHDLIADVDKPHQIQITPLHSAMLHSL